MIVPFLLAAAITVQVEPAKPTVGDPIVLTYGGGVSSVSLVESDAFEVVKVEGAKATIRSFRPGPFRVDAMVEEAGEVTARPVAIDLSIASVLAENDDLEPAPLAPPEALPANPAATVLLVVGGVAALVSWLALIAAARRRPAKREAVSLRAIDRYRRRVASLRGRRGDDVVAELADATRELIASAGSQLGPQWTTEELERHLKRSRLDGASRLAVLEILRHGDLAKFSPWGDESRMEAELVERALRVGIPEEGA